MTTGRRNISLTAVKQGVNTADREANSIDLTIKCREKYIRIRIQPNNKVQRENLQCSY